MYFVYGFILMYNLFWMIESAVQVAEVGVLGRPIDFIIGMANAAAAAAMIHCIARDIERNNESR